MSFSSRFCSASSLQIYKPSQKENEFAAVSMSWMVPLGRSMSGNPTISFFFLPGQPQ